MKMQTKRYENDGIAVPINRYLGTDRMQFKFAPISAAKREKHAPTKPVSVHCQVLTKPSSSEVPTIATYEDPVFWIDSKTQGMGIGRRPFELRRIGSDLDGDVPEGGQRGQGRDAS